LTTWSITKAAFSDGVGEGAKYLNPLDAGEGIEEWVSFDSDGPEVGLEARPSANLLRVGSFDHGSS